MPNPTGANTFEPTLPHGAVKEMMQQKAAAPLKGSPVSALNAPRRSKRHATGQDSPSGGGGSALQALQEAPLPTINEQPSDQARAERVALAWEEVARHPGASPLVKQYAREARESVGRGTG